MSGHSKWSKIRRKKGANDEARGKIFTKLSRNITLAAQQGGGDANMNFALRIAIDNAKAENLPADKIERAVKKGTGELKDGAAITQILYEGYGPGSTAILILSQTDNTNRAITEIKNVMNLNGGKMSPEGSVAWQFNEKGIFILSPLVYKDSGKFGKEGEYVPTNAEEMVLQIMEINGVEDVRHDQEENKVQVYSARDEFSRVYSEIEKMHYKIDDANLGRVANEFVNLNEEDSVKLENLLEELENNDEVSNVWHNAA
jgi:YebC/PmpR family DNA-binding regulatory protein